MNAERVEQLFEEAQFLPNTPTRVAILEEAVREAGHLQDDAWGYEARKELVTAATFSGLREKALVAFSWCLAYFDRNRGELDDYEEHSLLWSYKWIVGGITDFPQVSRGQIEQMLGDLERRLKAAGCGPRTANYYRYQNALFMGDLGTAREFHRKFMRQARDSLSDCDACECNRSAQIYFHTGQDEKGLETVDPILRGHLSCAEIPHTTLSHVLMPLTRLGRVDEAHRLQERGYRMISSNRDFLPNIALHMQFLAHHGEYNKPVRMFARHFGCALESAVPEYRFRLYLAGAVVFEALARKNNRKRKLRLPDAFELKSEDDSYKPDALAEWLMRETRQLADQFDRRNGNDAYTRHIDAAREAAGLG